MMYLEHDGLGPEQKALILAHNNLWYHDAVLSEADTHVPTLRLNASANTINPLNNHQLQMKDGLWIPQCTQHNTNSTPDIYLDKTKVS